MEVLEMRVVTIKDSPEKSKVKVMEAMQELINLEGEYIKWVKWKQYMSAHVEIVVKHKYIEEMTKGGKQKMIMTKKDLSGSRFGSHKSAHSILNKYRLIRFEQLYVHTEMDHSS